MTTALTQASAAIETYATGLAADDDDARRVTLFSAGPDTVMAQLVARYGEALSQCDIEVRAVFSDVQSLGQLESFISGAAGALANSGGSPVDGIRLARGSKYARCHEQLVLGQTAFLCGRRLGEAHKSCVDDVRITQRPGNVVAASSAFDVLWAAARPISSGAGILPPTKAIAEKPRLLRSIIEKFSRA